MREQPEIELKPERIDSILEVSGYTALALLWIFIIWEYLNLPDTIPIHFDMHGRADDFGDKSAVFGMPVITTFLFFMLLLMQLKIRSFRITEYMAPIEAEKRYAFVKRILRIMRIAIPLLFLTIEFFSRNRSEGEVSNSWLVPAFFALLFIPVGYLLIRAMRNK